MLIKKERLRYTKAFFSFAAIFNGFFHSLYLVFHVQLWLERFRDLNNRILFNLDAKQSQFQ